MSFITDYVLGFAFIPEGDVALIEKSRPDWQRGRLNGIGGHREGAMETPADAMAREFMEETGVSIEPPEWRKVGIMRCDNAWRCTVFTVVDNRVRKVRTTTDERVQLYSRKGLEFSKDKLIENVPALIELCRMRADFTGMIPMFHLDYTRE